MKFEKWFNILSRKINQGTLDYLPKGSVLSPDLYNNDGDEKLHVPIKLFLSEVEESALEQMYNVANLPFVFHHVAGMPDMHLGYGMPIGGVMASKGYIVPNAVGVDIGCGMCFIRTNLNARNIGRTILKNIMGDIRKLIPVGFKHNKNPQDGMPQWEGVDFSKTIIDREFKSAKKQLGTLGGGNHFIEIQKDDNDYICVMIHSGSRNLGNKVAEHYNKVAIGLNEKWLSQVPKKHELAFLPFHEPEGQMYFQEMNYCCDFALANRKLMMERVKECFFEHTKAVFYQSDFINIHHNFAALENHFGKNVIVHRKGATRAYQGELGIIPGSQGSKSYIVEGRGCADSFKSCSHGAGRALSRKKAKADLDLAAEIKILDDKGIIHGIRNKADLEEATSAYKDIDEVMYHQQELVLIRTELTPLAVVKG